MYTAPDAVVGNDFLVLFPDVISVSFPGVLSFQSARRSPCSLPVHHAYQYHQVGENQDHLLGA